MAKAAFILFIFTLLFSPLAFGTVEPWSLTVMETFALLALLLFLAGKMRIRDASFYETPGIIPLLCLLILIVIQLVPLPGEIIRIVSPETYKIYKETAYIGEPLPWLSLSLNKKAALREFFRISSYTAFYFLTVQILSRKDTLKKTVAIIIVFAALLSLFAILQRILWNGKIYWVRELTLGGDPFGPYVNRNHYAGLMEMLFPLALGLFLFYKPRSTYKSFRDRMAEIFSTRSTNTYVLLGFSSVLIATSIFLTLSRSGIVSMCLSMILFGTLFLSKGTERRRGKIIIVIFVLIVLSVGWFGWSPIIERFERVGDIGGRVSELRFDIWKDSRNIIEDFSLTGTGFGSFVNIYPKYRSIEGNQVADHAHNDYIELLADGGIPAFLLCASFFIVLFYKSYRAFLRRRELYSVYLYIAAVAGIASILMHSLTDFNLHIGANGLYMSFLAGLAVSAANTRLRNGLDDTYLKKMRLPLKSVTSLFAFFLLGCFIFQSGVTIGKMYFSSIRDIKLNERIPRQELISIEDASYMASFFDPLEAQYRYASANVGWILNKDIALRQYKEAVRLNPVNAEYLERLGLLMAEDGRYDIADKLLQAGMTYDVSNPARYRRYALWLFSMGRVEEGVGIMRTAILLEPQKTKEYITLMVLEGFSDEEILISLPDKVEPHLCFAEYLSRTGRDKMADEEYLRVLRYIDKEKRIKPGYFYAVYRYYLKNSRFKEALNVMQKAVDAFPRDTRIKLYTADLYEKLGIPFSAAEEYKKVLTIDPGSQEAIRRLDNLLKGMKDKK